MNEVNHEPGEVQAFEVFDGFSVRFVLAETGREVDRYLESDTVCDLAGWQ